MVSVSDKALWIDGLAGGRWFKVCLRVETFKWPLVKKDKPQESVLTRAKEESSIEDAKATGDTCSLQS